MGPLIYVLAILLGMLSLSVSFAQEPQLSSNQVLGPKEQDQRNDEIVGILKSCESFAHTSDAANRHLYQKVTQACATNESQGALGSKAKNTVQTVLSDTKLFHEKQTIEEMAKDLRKAQLAQALYATWGSYVRFNNSPPLNAESALKMICPDHQSLNGHASAATMCIGEDHQNLIKKYFLKFQKSAEITNYTQAAQASDLFKFNQLIDLYNGKIDQCKREQKALHPFTVNNDYQAQKEQNAITNFKLDLRKDSPENSSFLAVEDQLYDSNLGKNFLVTEDFRNKVGKMGLDCRTQKKLQKVSASDVDQAKKQFIAYAKDSVKDYNDGLHEEARDYVQNFIKEHPSLAGEFLKAKNSKAYAKISCKLINEINASDANWKYVDHALVGVGVVAGLAVTFGASTPFMAFVVGSEAGVAAAASAVVVNSGELAELAVATGVLSRGYAGSSRLEQEKKLTIQDYVNGADQNGKEAKATVREVKNLENETAEIVSDSLKVAVLAASPEAVLEAGNFLKKYKNLKTLANVMNLTEEAAEGAALVDVGSHAAEGAHHAESITHLAHEVTETTTKYYKVMKESLEARGIVLEGFGETTASTDEKVKLKLKLTPEQAIIESTYVASLKTDAERDAYFDQFEKGSAQEAYEEARRKFDALKNEEKPQEGFAK